MAEQPRNSMEKTSEQLIIASIIPSSAIGMD
jgi:hypothetical protein